LKDARAAGAERQTLVTRYFGQEDPIGQRATEVNDARKVAVGA